MCIRTFHPYMQVKSVRTLIRTLEVLTLEKLKLTLGFQNRLILLTLLSLYSSIKLHDHLIHHTKCL